MHSLTFINHPQPIQLPVESRRACWPIQHLQRHQKTPSSHWELATAGCHQATYIRISSQDFWQGWVSLRDRTLWTHSPTTDHTRHFSNLTWEADDSGSRKPVKTVMAMNQSDTAAMTTVIILGVSYSHCESKSKRSNKQEWQFWNTSITFKVLLLVRALWRLSQCQPDFWLNCFHNIVIWWWSVYPSDLRSALVALLCVYNMEEGVGGPSAY